jgi:hypothetical protein
VANLGSRAVNNDFSVTGEVLFSSDDKVPMDLKQGHLRPWSVIFLTKQPDDFEQ